VCAGCTKHHELYGSGGGQRIADYAQAPRLGQIPLPPSVREWGDAGPPVVQAAPGSDPAKAFVQVAERLLERLDSRDDPGVLTIDRSGGQNRRLPITR
jgi:ATP-binding protein involved in chromosome partitioning